MQVNQAANLIVVHDVEYFDLYALFFSVVCVGVWNLHFETANCAAYIAAIWIGHQLIFAWDLVPSDDISDAQLPLIDEVVEKPLFLFVVSAWAISLDWLEYGLV